VPAHERAHIAATKGEESGEHRDYRDGGYDDEGTRHG
jgi:hypothetical protein